MQLDSRYLLHTKIFEIFKKKANQPLSMPVNMVEVGLGFGDFATYLINSCGTALSLTSVESWQGRFMKRRMIDCRDEVMDRMDKYMQQYDYNVLETNSSDASKHFEDGSLDVVYIDADHGFHGCYNDLVKWYPKLCSGGIFSGHDYVALKRDGVRRAVNKFTQENNLNFGVTEDVNPHPSWFLIKP